MRLCSVSATRRTRPLLPTRLAGAPPSDTQPTGDSSPLLPIWRPAVTPCESTMAAAMPTIPRTPPGCAHASRNEKRVQRARHCKGGIQEENRVQRTARMKKEKLGRRNQGQAKKEKAGPPPEPAAYSLRLSPPPPAASRLLFPPGGQPAHPHRRERDGGLGQLLAAPSDRGSLFGPHRDLDPLAQPRQVARRRATGAADAGKAAGAGGCRPGGRPRRARARAPARATRYAAEAAATSGGGGPGVGDGVGAAAMDVPGRCRGAAGDDGGGLAGAVHGLETATPVDSTQ